MQSRNSSIPAQHQNSYPVKQTPGTFAEVVNGGDETFTSSITMNVALNNQPSNIASLLIQQSQRGRL